MKKIIIATALVVTAFSSAAYADEDNKNCTGEPQANWQSQDAMKAKGQELGYDVRQVKLEGSCYEVYAVKDGRKMELLFNPVSLEQVGLEDGEMNN